MLVSVYLFPLSPNHTSVPCSVPQEPDLPDRLIAVFKLGLTNERQQEDMGEKDRGQSISSPLSLLWFEYLCSPKIRMSNVMVLQGGALGHKPGALVHGIDVLIKDPRREFLSPSTICRHKEMSAALKGALP